MISFINVEQVTDLLQSYIKESILVDKHKIALIRTLPAEVSTFIRKQIKDKSFKKTKFHAKGQNVKHNKNKTLIGLHVQNIKNHIMRYSFLKYHEY